MSVIIQELEANEPSAAARGLVPGLATAVLPGGFIYFWLSVAVPSEDNEPAELNVTQKDQHSCDTISAVSAKLYCEQREFPHGADLVTEEVFATAPRDAISDLSWQLSYPRMSGQHKGAVLRARRYGETVPLAGDFHCAQLGLKRMESRPLWAVDAK